MRVEELTCLGRYWYSEVYASNYDRDIVQKYANMINYKLAEADLRKIVLKPGPFRNNRREPLIYLNNRAYAYQTLAEELYGCTVTWMLHFLNGELDINQMGGDLYRYKRWLQLLAVIVCVAEVGRGMTRSPQCLAEFLDEEKDWKNALKRFAPALPSAADSRTNWIDESEFLV